MSDITVAPIAVEIMLHYYYSAADYRNGDFSAPAVRQFIDMWRDLGLLEASAPNNYEITEGGRLYVEAICNVPVPVRKWVTP